MSKYDSRQRGRFSHAGTQPRGAEKLGYIPVVRSSVVNADEWRDMKRAEVDPVWPDNDNAADDEALPLPDLDDGAADANVSGRPAYDHLVLSSMERVSLGDEELPLPDMGTSLGDGDLPLPSLAPTEHAGAEAAQPGSARAAAPAGAQPGTGAPEAQPGSAVQPGSARAAARLSDPLSEPALAPVTQGLPELDDPFADELASVLGTQRQAAVREPGSAPVAAPAEPQPGTGAPGAQPGSAPVAAPAEPQPGSGAPGVQPGSAPERAPAGAQPGRGMPGAQPGSAPAEAPAAAGLGSDTPAPTLGSVPEEHATKVAAPSAHAQSMPNGSFAQLSAQVHVEAPQDPLDEMAEPPPFEPVALPPAQVATQLDPAAVVTAPQKPPPPPQTRRASSVQSDDMRIATARAWIEAGRVDEGFALLEQLCAQQPDNEACRALLLELCFRLPRASKVLGHVEWAQIRLLQTGRMADACELYRRLRHAFPELTLSERVLLLAIEAGDRTGDAQVVIDAAKLLVHLCPASAYLGRVLVKVADYQLAGGRPDLSRATLEYVLAHCPNDPAALVARQKLGQT